MSQQIVMKGRFPFNFLLFYKILLFSIVIAFEINTSLDFSEFFLWIFIIYLFIFVSPELSSVRDYVITHSVRSM